MGNSFGGADRRGTAGYDWSAPNDRFGSRSPYTPEFTDFSVPYSEFAPYGPYEIRTTNRLAVAALVVTLFNLVVGTLSLILFPPLTLSLCLAGIVLGHLALAAIRRTHQAGRSLAVAALVLSYIGLFFEVAVLVGLGLIAGLWMAMAS